MKSSVGAPQFSPDDTDSSMFANFDLEPGVAPPRRSVAVPVGASLAAVLVMLALLSITRGPGEISSLPPGGGSQPETSVQGATTILNPETVEDQLGVVADEGALGLGEVGRDQLPRRPVDLVVRPLSAIDDGYGGFISGTLVDGKPLFVVSDNGFGWDQSTAIPASGLPSEVVPRGLWQASDGSLIGAFTKSQNGAVSLWFATSIDGGAWTLGPSFESDVRLQVEDVVPTRDGALLTITESAGGGDRSTQSYIWARDEGELFALDLDPGAYVSAATDSLYGLVVAVSPTTDDDGEFGGQIRLYADESTWTALDLDTGPFPTFEVVPTAFPEVMMLTADGAYRTDWDRLLTGEGEVIWEFIDGIIPSDVVGEVEVSDVMAGPGGAAALLLRPDQRTRFTVVVTRDYRTWTPVVIGSESRDEPTTVQIDAVGDDEVILSGFANGPYRVRVPFDAEG